METVGYMQITLGTSVSFGHTGCADIFTQAGRFQLGVVLVLFCKRKYLGCGARTQTCTFQTNSTPLQIHKKKKELLQINGVEYEVNTAVFQNNFGQANGFTGAKCRKDSQKQLHEKMVTIGLC
jgi:hypothetical protein